MSKVTAENFESNVDYTTVLSNFEGPLDLLLYLIRCNEIEIRDIFVSQVMEQFLAYMRGLPYLDADKASEYLVIASTILSIKAKSLSVELNTVRHAGSISTALIFGVPAVVLIGGFVIWMKRRKA